MGQRDKIFTFWGRFLKKFLLAASPALLLLAVDVAPALTSARAAVPSFFPPSNLRGERPPSRTTRYD